MLFFTFIHPSTMAIPPSFKKLAATRGTDQPGAVPQDTVIIFAIGGSEAEKGMLQVVCGNGLQLPCDFQYVTVVTIFQVATLIH